jgi:hypothetical protein
MDAISEPALHSTTLSRRMSNWMSAWWWPFVAAGIGLSLSLPALHVGWVGDDYWHRYVLDPGVDSGELGIIESDSLMYLFSFLDGDPERNARLIETGAGRWWMSLKAKGAFWRPLAALSHLIDYRLWPKRAELMHLQSLLWGAVLAVAVGFLHRRIMGPTWVAGLATLLYAIDDARGTPVGFLANRSTLLAGTFGVLCVLAHDQWRRRQWRLGAAVAPILLACSLLSKEAGIATIAYLFAHAVCLDRGKLLQKVKILMPYVAVVVAWRITWTVLGFGFAGADLYVDPLEDPLVFLVRCVERFPVLLFGQWGLPSDITLIAEGSLALIWWLVAVAALVAIGWLVGRTVRWDPVTRFWGLGMLLSVVPICSVFPSDRLLTFVGVGATPLLARFFASFYGLNRVRLPRHSGRVVAHLVGVFLVLVHAVLASIGLALRAGHPIGPTSLHGSYYDVPADEAVAEQSMVFVNPPMALMIGFVRVIGAIEGRPYPKRVRVLSSSGAATELTRIDERTLVVRPEGGFLSRILDSGFRSKDDPFTLGQRIELPEVTVEITAPTDDGRPAEVTYHFKVPLEHGSLRWLYWNGERYAPFTPPDIGESIRL